MSYFYRARNLFCSNPTGSSKATRDLTTKTVYSSWTSLHLTVNQNGHCSVTEIRLEFFAKTTAVSSAVVDGLSSIAPLTLHRTAMNISTVTVHFYSLVSRVISPLTAQRITAIPTSTIHTDGTVERTLSAGGSRPPQVRVGQAKRGTFLVVQ